MSDFTIGYIAGLLLSQALFWTIAYWYSHKSNSRLARYIRPAIDFIFHGKWPE